MPQKIDLTGQTFGRLTVIEQDLEKSKEKKRVYWKCICECGKEKSIVSSDLRGGKTLSCGCLRNEKIREAVGNKLSGQEFGYLTVIDQVDSITEESGTVRTAWRCKCRCGNEVIVKTINLKSGDTKSCGCIHSHGETKIETILREQQVDYAQQYVFKDLISEKGGNLKFDFAIFNEGKLCYLIEFQGIQHYEAIEFFGGSKQLEIQNKNDKLKIDYCEKNKIPLLIFTYKDMDIITYDLIKEKYNEKIHGY